MAEASPKNSGPEKEYVFGVFPYLAPREIERIYAPIAAEFAAVTGQRFFFSTNSSFNRFHQNMDNEIYDIVFVQPFFYAEIADRYGYRPIAVRAESLPAILVVKPDSPIRNLQQLKGKIIALPPRSAAISYLVKDYLTKHGMRVGQDVTLKHHRSHANCMQQVLVNAADACGTAPPALRFFTEKMKTRLDIIVRTPGIANSLFAAHPRVPKQIIEKLRNDIIGWQNHDKGKRLLKSVKVSGFTTARDSDYDPVRRLAKSIE